MKYQSKLIAFFASVAMLAVVGCDNTKSYAELLNDENHATNMFLVNQRVECEVPADSVFEVGPNAPFYRMDNEGTVFMQVLNAGTPGYKAEKNQLIYFRFTRYSLYNYTFTKGDTNIGGVFGDLGDGDGNDKDLSMGSASFRFDNQTNSSSYQWGTGLQTPLYYLPLDCEVNLVIKSQSGLYSEISSVTPYLYSVRYFKSQI